MEIKKVIFSSLASVAYDHRYVLGEDIGNNVTIEFSLEDKLNKIDGYIEVSKDEFEKNAKWLDKLVINRLIETLK
ncbi:hypothetical protein P4571_08490 [Niallia alba]|uniref:hypothetical protein n=1 Tax=Niallia alba TaxID=2729105 RepID=UPI002E2225B2|nr:hypothetical protein [Niallia alba]